MNQTSHFIEAKHSNPKSAQVKKLRGKEAGQLSKQRSLKRNELDVNRRESELTASTVGSSSSNSQPQHQRTISSKSHSEQRPRSLVPGNEAKSLSRRKLNAVQLETASKSHPERRRRNLLNPNHYGGSSSSIDTEKSVLSNPRSHKSEAKIHSERKHHPVDNAHPRDVSLSSIDTDPSMLLLQGVRRRNKRMVNKAGGMRLARSHSPPARRIRPKSSDKIGTAVSHDRRQKSDPRSISSPRGGTARGASAPRGTQRQAIPTTMSLKSGGSSLKHQQAAPERQQRRPKLKPEGSDRSLSLDDLLITVGSQSELGNSCNSGLSVNSTDGILKRQGRFNGRSVPQLSYAAPSQKSAASNFNNSIESLDFDSREIKKVRPPLSRSLQGLKQHQSMPQLLCGSPNQQKRRGTPAKQMSCRRNMAEGRGRRQPIQQYGPQLDDRPRLKKITFSRNTIIRFPDSHQAQVLDTNRMAAKRTACHHPDEVYVPTPQYSTDDDDFDDFGFQTMTGRAMRSIGGKVRPQHRSQYQGPPSCGGAGRGSPQIRSKGQQHKNSPRSTRKKMSQQGTRILSNDEALRFDPRSHLNFHDGIKSKEQEHFQDAIMHRNLGVQAREREKFLRDQKLKEEEEVAKKPLEQGKKKGVFTSMFRKKGKKEEQQQPAEKQLSHNEIRLVAATAAFDYGARL